MAFEAEFPGTVALAAQDPEEVVTAALDLIGGIDALISNDAYLAIRAPVDEADPNEIRRHGGSSRLALQADWRGGAVDESGRIWQNYYGDLGGADPRAG